MIKNSGIKLECLAIGSLPCNNPELSKRYIELFNIPFWPQLAKVSKKEDMTFQFLEAMPSFSLSEDFSFSFDTENETFFAELEQFFLDYEEIISENNEALLEKYAITENFASAFKYFIEIITTKKSKFAKGQITGPFTLASTLKDKQGRCAIYDDTLREIIVKTLSLKALWQIKRIKNAGSVPIIFIDEPSISQLGTSTFLTISREEVISMLKEISDIIKSHGAISAVHCCGKCDWTVPIEAEIDIINLDAYLYAENLSVYSKPTEKFLLNGGKIAWGVVPTLDREALEKIDLNQLISKFDNAVKYLTKKGINEKLIIDNSLITPSCGAGSLPEDLALKALNLTKELSISLKERYNDN